MKNNFFSFFLLVGIIFSESAYSEGRKIFNPKHEFSVKVPESWEKVHHPMSNVQIALLTEKNGYAGQCVIFSFPSPETKKFTHKEIEILEKSRSFSPELIIENINKSGGKPKLISYEKIYKGNNFGHSTIYTHLQKYASIKNIMFMKSENFFIARPSNTYSFTCSVGSSTVAQTAQAFETEKKAFDQLYSSFIDASEK